MSKINVREILAKHMTQKGDSSEENIAAIKEIVESVADKCKEYADTKREIEFDGEKHYDINVIDKDSIDSVKQMIDYD